ncbi:MAG: DUF2752 domain-containing protein [Chitinispirillales bacterium]|jgi:hypothetical protein|nr:DUF2752 domain-containing protein [Chitinispirillales bacterium]
MNEQIQIHTQTQPRIRRGVELCKFLTVLALSFAVPLVLRLAPDGAERFYPKCVWNAATGLYCPGCGTLRACKALGSFDIPAAFLYNPFLFLAIAPLAAYMCVIFLMRVITGRWVPSILSSCRAALPAAVIIIAVWLARNIFHI